MQKIGPSEEASYEKPLPSSVECERLILGSCLSNPKSVAVAVDSLSPEDFSLEKHKRIFLRIAGLYQMQHPVDRVTIAESLTAHGQLQSVDGISYIVSLDDGLPEISNVASYIAIVKEKSRLRQLALIGTDLIARATEGGAESREIGNAVSHKIYSVCHNKERGDPQDFADVVTDIGFENIINPSRQRGDGVYTGYHGLDELTGGIFPTENWIFGAAPGVGKSSVCLQIACNNALRKIPSVIFSMEMSKRSVFNRLLCQRAKVSIRRFRSGEASENEGERRKLLDAFGELQELPILIDDTFALRPSDVESKLKMLIETRGVQLALFDFIQKMRPDHSRGNENDRLTEVCDSFVGLSKSYCPSVIFSQLSRSHRKNKEKPSLEDLRGTGSLEQLGNVIVFLYREEMEKGKGQDESIRGKAEFIVAKNREGDLANLKMRYIGWQMKYEDIEEV